MLVCVCWLVVYWVGYLGCMFICGLGWVELVGIGDVVVFDLSMLWCNVN